MYKLKLDLPTVPKGQGVLIDGLGELENGKTYTFDEETNQAFMVAHSTQETEVLEDGIGVKTVLGPSLHEASFQEGITVEKHADRTKKKEGDS